MSKSRVICINCREHVDYDIIEVEDVCPVNELLISYVRKDGMCKQCGNWVYVEELEKYNVEEPLRLYFSWKDNN